MARALLAVRGRCVIVSHVRPDGDAIGSSLGLCRALRAAGREAVCVALGPISDVYDFLLDPAAGEIVPSEAFEPAPGDVLVVVDCGVATRLRDCARPLASRMPVLCIDHHEPGPGFPGAAMLVEPRAGSASEIVFRVARLAGLPVDRSAAEAFWTGVVTDTGRFSYDSTSPDTLRAGAALVALGVRTQFIAERVYGRVPLARLRLQSRFLSNLSVYPGWRIEGLFGCPGGKGLSRREELPETVAKYADFVWVTEEDPGLDDVSAICGEWGGGGHVAAAGATFDASTDLADVVATVTARLVRAVSSPPPKG